MSNYDLYARIQALRSELRGGRKSQLVRSFSHEDRIQALEDENAHLKLVLAGAVQLLLSKGVFSADELVDQAKRIDALDGEADGKLRGTLALDGQVTPAPAPPASALDELSRAVQEEEGSTPPKG